MWRMLCGRATDLRVEHSEVEAEGDEGSAHWEAYYTFSTGRAGPQRDRGDVRVPRRHDRRPPRLVRPLRAGRARRSARSASSSAGRRRCSAGSGSRRGRAWTSSWRGAAAGRAASERAPLGVRHVLAARRARADPRARRGDDRRRGRAAAVRRARRARRAAARAGPALPPAGHRRRPGVARATRCGPTTRASTSSWHVRRVALPAPGGMAELRELVGRIMSEPLDFTRPLWQLYLVEGLERERHAYVSKTHHALVDGVAAVDVGTIILDAEPGRDRDGGHRGALGARRAEPGAALRPRRLGADPHPAAGGAQGGPGGGDDAALDRRRG